VGYELHVKSCYDVVVQLYVILLVLTCVVNAWKGMFFLSYNFVDCDSSYKYHVDFDDIGDELLIELDCTILCCNWLMMMSP